MPRTNFAAEYFCFSFTGFFYGKAYSAFAAK